MNKITQIHQKKKFSKLCHNFQKNDCKWDI